MIVLIYFHYVTQGVVSPRLFIFVHGFKLLHPCARKREWRISALEAEYLNQLAGAHCFTVIPISVDYTCREIMIAPTVYHPFLLVSSFADITRVLRARDAKASTTKTLHYRLESVGTFLSSGREEEGG